VAKHKAKHTLTVQASTKHLSDVRNFVARHASECGFKKQDIADIRLAVDEAYTNIIEHAYNHDDSKSVEIELGYNNKELWVSLIDTGDTFDLSEYTDPDVRKKIKERKRGGVGVYLIKKLMDSVEYLKEGGINEIRLVKKK